MNVFKTTNFRNLECYLHKYSSTATAKLLSKKYVDIHTRTLQFSVGLLMNRQEISDELMRFDQFTSIVITPNEGGLMNVTIVLTETVKI